MRLAHISVVILAMASLFPACVTTPSWVYRAVDLAKAGQCDAAESEIARSDGEPGNKFFVLSAVEYECRDNEALGNRYLTLGARYGHPGAQHFLIQRGLPVPPADLAGPGAPSMAEIISTDPNLRTIGEAIGRRIR